VVLRKKWTFWALPQVFAGVRRAETGILATQAIGTNPDLILRREP